MKKTLWILALAVGMLTFGANQGYATTPTANGTILDAFEWDNIDSGGGAYPFYLSVTDPNEGDNQFDNTDISRAVVLQELTSFSGDGNFMNDGIYILIEVYAPPPTLDFQPAPITGVPNIKMQGDLLGDRLTDGFNIFLRHYNTVADDGTIPDIDRVEICVGSVFTCTLLPLGAGVDLLVAGGAFGRGTVLEYFIPAGTFGTPPSPPGTPFPVSFVGTITYDNGAGGPLSSDDVVIGSIFIPEPASMMLLGTGLLSLLGFRRKKYGSK